MQPVRHLYPSFVDFSIYTYSACVLVTRIRGFYFWIRIRLRLIFIWGHLCKKTKKKKTCILTTTKYEPFIYLFISILLMTLLNERLVGKKKMRLTIYTCDHNIIYNYCGRPANGCITAARVQDLHRYSVVVHALSPTCGCQTTVVARLGRIVAEPKVTDNQRRRRTDSCARRSPLPGHFRTPPPRPPRRTNALPFYK